ncbi:MAG TPA: CHAT domain-containing protein [Spirochaetota bacterium]|nr:CHAT domain-containing protein [Spirochaetota bacterium]
MIEQRPAHAVDPELTRRLKAAKRKERFRLYFDEVRPRITEILREQAGERARSGLIPRYGRLALTLGHNPIPSLIVANAFAPPKLVLFHPPRHGKLLRERVLPALDGSIPRGGIETIELSSADHDANYAAIRGALASRPFDGHTLCDITGGKKILSMQLGLIARELGFDLCYIDSESYIPNSDIPEPGSESLYIHSADRDGLTSIRMESAPRLTVSLVPATGAAVFNFDADGTPYKFTLSDLSDSVVETVRAEIDAIYARINANVLRGEDSQRELDDLAGLVRSMLMPQGLDERIRGAAGGLRLHLDTELAGIPWEVAFNRLYGTPIPLQRMFNRTIDYRRLEPTTQKKEGALVILGSAEGIPLFGEIADWLGAYSLRSPVKIRTAVAESRGALQKELGTRRYDAVLYFGHSEYGPSEEETGWRCVNGEIFHCGSLRCIENTPPDLIISNSCHSARSMPFAAHSFACSAMRAGVRTYIGTRWLLEFERSRAFLEAVTDAMLVPRVSPARAFARALAALAERFGGRDIALYNYVYYGK